MGQRQCGPTRGQAGPHGLGTSRPTLRRTLTYSRLSPLPPAPAGQRGLTQFACQGLHGALWVRRKPVADTPARAFPGMPRSSSLPLHGFTRSSPGAIGALGDAGRSPHSPRSSMALHKSLCREHSSLPFTISTLGSGWKTAQTPACRCGLRTAFPPFGSHPWGTYQWGETYKYTQRPLLDVSTEASEGDGHKYSYSGTEILSSLQYNLFYCPGYPLS